MAKLISMKKLTRKLFLLYLKIVREKASPEYIARGWAIGMFYGCLIPFGFQLICSIPTALLLRGSKIGAVFGTLLTNQFTIFLIYPLQCYVGGWLVGNNLSYTMVKQVMKDVVVQQNYKALFELSSELCVAFFIGGALLTLLMTPLTYFAVKIMVIKYRNARSRRLLLKT